MVLFDLLIFVVTLAILVKASDYFVEASQAITEMLKISSYVIGFTLVAIGTSLPEMVSSIGASYYKSSGLILGNIIGSNIANIGMVLGLAAIIGTIANIKKRVFDKEGIFLISISILFLVFSANLRISRIEALFLLLLFIGYSFYIIKFNVLKKLYTSIPLLEDFIEYRILKKTKKEEVKEKIEEEVIKEKKPIGKIMLEVLKIILSGAAMIFSVEFLIPAAQRLALGLGISETIIGITLLAVGTSLPELMVAISSVRKGLGDLLVGTVIGSNISNLLLVGGISAFINPLTLSTTVLYYFIPSMIILTIALLSFIRAKWQIRTYQGFILIALYIIFILTLFFLK